MAQRVCLFIGPTGAEGSEQRRRFDGVYQYIVAPAAEAVGLTPVRPDQIVSPGQITAQVLELLVEAPAVVADLTSANPNVYYEVAVRHSSGRPIVLLAEEGEPLPFDIANMRVVLFDHRDLSSAARARETVRGFLEAQLKERPTTPVAGLQPERAAREVADQGRAEALSWILHPVPSDGLDDRAPAHAVVHDKLVGLAVAWLRKKWADAECPYCRARDWRVGEDVVRLPIFGSDRAYPAFPVVCGNCGQTAFINAVQAGVIGPETQ